VIRTPYGIKSETLYRPGKPIRDPEYLRFVRSFPCAVCSKQWGVDPCHTGPHGLRQKSSDLSCIPLCRAHHRTGNDALDKIGPVRFEERFKLDIHSLIEQLNELYQERTRRKTA
jgi:hypothetical protein